MNLSKTEQRVLHVLAQGGHVRHQRGPGGKILAVTCYTHDGLVLTDCPLPTVLALRRKRLIASHDGGPYRLTRQGRLAVRSQPDNRCKEN